MRDILVSVCLLLSIIHAENIDKEHLRLVHVVWRHGDRNPEHFLKADPSNGPDSWPQGPGEITPLGMNQQFVLGQWLKDRYRGFVSDEYKQDEIFVRSTSFNRTLQSAIANLAGFYSEPSADARFRPEIPWVPVPVHSQPREFDPLLWMDFPCPRESEIWSQVDTSEAAMQIMADNKEFLDYIRNVTGRPFPTPLSLDDAYALLMCEYNHLDEHTPPNWANRSVFEKIKDIWDKAYSLKYGTTEWQRLRGGMLLNEIVSRMADKAKHNANNGDWKLKYIAYSGHDHDIMSMLQALRASNNRVPQYASTLMFELYERNGKYEVELHYQNESNFISLNYNHPPPHRMYVAGCSDSCPLDLLQDIVKPFAPDDFFAECGLGSLNTYIMDTVGHDKVLMRLDQLDNTHQAVRTTALIVGLGIAVVMLLVAVIYLAVKNCLLRRRQNAILTNDFIPALYDSYNSGTDEKTPLFRVT